MLFGNRYGSYRGQSNNTLSNLILVVLISFLAYYAYTHYLKKSEEETALTESDEKTIKSMVADYESKLRNQYAKDEADREDTNGVCSDAALKNKYACENKNRCSIPEIVDKETCLQTTGARWEPHTWTVNNSAANAGTGATEAGADAGADAASDAGAATDTGADTVTDTGTATATDTAAGSTAAATDAGAAAGDSEGFLNGMSNLLDEPFMAYNSGSSLVGADLTESFMPFSELN